MGKNGKMGRRKNGEMGKEVGSSRLKFGFLIWCALLVSTLESMTDFRKIVNCQLISIFALLNRWCIFAE